MSAHVAHTFGKPRRAALFAVVRRSDKQRAAAGRQEEFRKHEQLILSGLDMVHRNAKSIVARCRAQFDKDDLVGAGVVALVGEADRFDPARGVSFAQFARKRVRGAMWELVRRRNWREASHLELVPEQVHVADTRQTPHELLTATLQRELAENAIAILDTREQMVVRRYYGDEDLGSIGADLGVSASMASLIHRQALAKMQQYFALRGQRAA